MGHRSCIHVNLGVHLLVGICTYLCMCVFMCPHECVHEFRSVCVSIGMLVSDYLCMCLYWVWVYIYRYEHMSMGMWPKCMHKFASVYVSVHVCKEWGRESSLRDIWREVPVGWTFTLGSFQHTYGKWMIKGVDAVFFYYIF